MQICDHPHFQKHLCMKYFLSHQVSSGYFQIGRYNCKQISDLFQRSELVGHHDRSAWWKQKSQIDMYGMNETLIWAAYSQAYSPRLEEFQLHCFHWHLHQLEEAII